MPDTTPINSVTYKSPVDHNKYFRIFYFILFGAVLITFALVCPGEQEGQVGEEIANLGIAKLVRVPPPAPREQGP